MEQPTNVPPLPDVPDMRPKASPGTVRIVFGSDGTKPAAIYDDQGNDLLPHLRVKSMSVAVRHDRMSEALIVVEGAQAAVDVLPKGITVRESEADGKLRQKLDEVQAFNQTLKDMFLRREQRVHDLDKAQRVDAMNAYVDWNVEQKVQEEAPTGSAMRRVLDAGNNLIKIMQRNLDIVQRANDKLRAEQPKNPTLATPETLHDDSN